MTHHLPAARRASALVVAVALAGFGIGACAGGDAPRADPPSTTSGTGATGVGPTGGLDLPTTQTTALDVATTVPSDLDLPGWEPVLDLRTCTLVTTIADTSVGFTQGSAVVSDDGRRDLGVLAGELATATAVSVVGHTSTEGEAPYNQDLSEQRATAVAAVLAAALPAVHVAPSGRGETEPRVSPEVTEGDRAGNRRVVVTASIQAEQCT